VKRIELKGVRVCSRCGRGRAELESTDGERLEVPLDAPRARELSGERDEVRSLATFVLDQVATSGAEPGEVVLDVGPSGLRALLSLLRNGEAEVIGCTAQEGVELAVRGDLSLYATDQALAGDADEPADPTSRNTVH
jgi:hypothetical protein